MISVTILTKNNADTLKKTLDSVKYFEEIIILDNGSSDNTLSIAASYANVKIFKSDFEGFGKLRKKASIFAKNDWILVLDSDEELSLDLLKELSKLQLNSKEIYSFPFANFFNNKHIKWCGWHKEYHIRLYNKKYTNFDEALVHEGIIKKNLKIIKLKCPINHYSYRSIDDFLLKMHKYSSLFASQNRLKKKSSLLKAILHGSFSFFRSYIIKRGLLGGKEGFIISFYNANTAFYKYLKLEELSKKK